MKIKDLHGKVIAEFPDHCIAVFEIPSGPIHVCICQLGSTVLAAAEDRAVLKATRGTDNQTIFLETVK